MLKLELTKPGTPKPAPLQLNLHKGARFSVELAWNCTHDLDAHALLASNTGNGAKVTEFGQVLSTYNCKKTNPGGTLMANPNGSFSTPCGGLTHSGDSRDGTKQGVDEVITIDASRIDQGVNEIPIFVTVHPSGQMSFAEVKEASISIKDEAGKLLGAYQLSTEFAAFNAVQMGSLVRNAAGGWDYAPIGVGFSGTFNDVLANFS